MTMSALKIRVRNIVEDDWRGKAERLLDIRKTAGKGDVSTKWLIVYPKLGSTPANLNAPAALRNLGLLVWGRQTITFVSTSHQYILYLFLFCFYKICFVH